MWVIPKNLSSTCSLSAQATLGSKEDLTLLESDIESSLTWRSKVSPLRTWLQRWKRVNWVRPLFTRILKPSHRTSFEAQLTLLLEGIRASRSVQLGSEREKMIHDTSGRSFTTTSPELIRAAYSLKMSRVTSHSDFEKSSPAWKAEVTRQPGVYLARSKLAHRTRESASTLWQMPTPTVGAEAPNKNSNSNGPKNLLEIAKGQWNHLWPTPRASEYKDCGPVGSKSHAHMLDKAYLCAKVKSIDQPRGMLNPAWVAWLMGIPAEWIVLGSWATESSLKPQPSPGPPSTTNLITEKKRQNMKRIAWSYSRLNDFENCPRKFQGKYVSKDFPKENFDSPHLIRGRAVHKELEDAVVLGTPLDPTRKHLEPLVAALRRSKLVIAEQQVCFNARRQEKTWFAKDAWCRMIFDVIAGDSSHYMVNLDWKTGKVRRESKDQLKMFTGGIFEKYPDVQTVLTAYIWVDHPLEPPTWIEYKRRDNESIWEEFGDRSEMIQLANEAGNWPATPNPLCKWCPAAVGQCEFKT